VLFLLVIAIEDMFDRIQHVYPVLKKNQGRVFLYMMYEEGERDKRDK
jgi:hypothetical protein